MRFISSWIFSSGIKFSLINLTLSSKASPVNHEFLNSSVSTSENLNILAVLFMSGWSHFMFFKPLLKELARRGHNLTVLSHHPWIHHENDPILPNYKDIVVKDPKSYNKGEFDLSNIDTSNMRYLEEPMLLRTLGLSYCEKSLKDPNTLEFLNSSQNFDLIITEAFNADCALGFVHKYKAPFITMSSHAILPWINDRLGNPDNPSYISDIFIPLFIGRMNFFQRVLNTLHLCFTKIFYEIGTQRHNQKLVEDVFGPGVPPLEQIAKETSALLINTHYSIHGSRPYTLNVIEVGGLHISKPKPLPADFKKFLDDANEGVILFSWGSRINSSSLSEEKLNVLLNVFEKLPRKIIWKWESDNVPRKLKNLMVKKWLPQFDIMSEYGFK